MPPTSTCRVYPMLILLPNLLISMKSSTSSIFLCAQKIEGTEHSAMPLSMIEVHKTIPAM